MNPSSPRKDVARNAVLLCLATVGLVAFILGVGDFRRQRNAIAQVRWHASIFERRVGAGGLLPLNFEPEVPPEGVRKMIPLEWLDRESAAALRGSDWPIIVARTIPILRVFGRDGRAVLTFRGGKFAVEWVTVAQSDAAYAAQKELVRRLGAEKAGEAPIAP